MHMTLVDFHSLVIHIELPSHPHPELEEQVNRKQVEHDVDVVGPIVGHYVGIVDIVCGFLLDCIRWVR